MPPAIPPRSAFIVDGHSQLYKAFYALQNLSTSKGQPTNMVFGFHQILARLCSEHCPTHLAVVLDAAETSFRNELYGDYKKQRIETPSEFLSQLPYIHRLLAALNIPVLSQPDVEADDVLATLATRIAATGDFTAIIVSADKDLFQVVGPRVLMLRTTPEKRDAELFDADAVKAKMGVMPSQMVDFQAIVGDSIDNIPGLPGFGPKFAALLLGYWPQGIAQMYADPNLESRLRAIKGFGAAKVKAVLESRQLAEMSYDLARLRCDLELPVEVPGGLERRDPNVLALAELFRELEFHALLRELESGRSPFVSSETRAILAAAAPTAGQAAAVSAAPAFIGIPQAAGQAVAAHESGAAQQADLLAGLATMREESRRITQYRAIQRLDDLEACVAEIRAAGLVAFDTETTGDSSMATSLVGIALSHAPSKGVYIPVGHDFMAASGGQIALDDVVRVLGPVFADSAVAKVAHHAKYDVKVLRRHGMEVNGLIDDTLIAAHLLDSDRDSHGLKQLAHSALGIAMQPITDLIGSGRHQIGMDQVPIERVTPYACADADCTLQLHRLFKPLIEEAGLAALLREVELPLVDVLDRMEMRGIAVDAEVLDRLKAQLTERMAALEGSIHQAAGEVFNLRSPKQVGEVLFERLKLPTQKKTKTGYSTDVSVLEALRREHPIVELLLEYRVLEKLLSTYVEQLPRLVHRGTGRIHCTLNQMGAATGRLSCNDPNLQNIPARTAIGREIRRAFVAGRPGCVLMSADYSQVELRILAHMSGDEALCAAFASGADIHALTASKIYKVALEDVTREQRGIGKTINFGIVYGMSAFRLAADLEIPRETAQQFIRDYFAGYPGVGRWIEETKARVREVGYCTTMLGRRRPVREINSPVQNIRSAAERIAINSPIQGTAADLIKLAMLTVERRLAAECPECQMLLQVHDELLFEVPEALAPQAAAVVREAMSQALPLSVPLEVDVAWGASWADCK